MSAIQPEPPAETGYLHSSGSPAVKIKVWGVFQGAAQEFEAIIDTGFSGFLSMPMVQAFPLGLVLVGTTNVVLADGSTDTKLTALGTIALESGLSKIGVVILEPNVTDILVGMDFLNRFERTLLLFGERAIPAESQTTKPVLLISNKVVHAVLDQIRKIAQEAATAAAAHADEQPPTVQAKPPTDKPPAN